MARSYALDAIHKDWMLSSLRPLRHNLGKVLLGPAVTTAALGGGLTFGADRQGRLVIRSIAKAK